MSFKIVLRVTGILTLAFVLTSAVMFWLPYLGNVLRYDKNTYYASYTPRRGEGYGYESGEFDYYDTITRELKKRATASEQEQLDKISAKLKQETSAKLYELRAYSDVCVNDLINCRGLPSTKVKPFIDAILSARQTSDAAAFSHNANLISGGSLFVSFIALIFTGLSFRRRRAFGVEG